MASPSDWDRNATWAGGSQAGAEGSRAHVSQAFGSFTRTSGKKASDNLDASESTTPGGTASRSSTPAPGGSPSPAGLNAEDLDKATLADDLDKKVKVSSRRSSVSNKSIAADEASKGLSSAGKDTQAAGVEKVEEDSPLRRAQKNPYHRPLPGHPGNLTTAQAEALLDLTLRLKEDGALHNPDKDPPSHQETQLLRFLRARNFNVDAARSMYLKAEAWKKDFELDRLCEEFVFEEEEAVAAAGWRMYFHKVDKLGRPIFVQDLSNLKTDALLKATTPDRIIKKFAVTLELAVRHRYEACTLSSERWVDDNMMVINIEGLGLSTFWTMKDQLQQLLSVLDQNFPELSGRVQIINAPWMFSSIWSLLKGWLPAATVEKVDIAGSNYLPLIFKYVRKEDWPEKLGGGCCCEDPMVASKRPEGCLRSDVGPWDPALVAGGKPRAPASSKSSPSS